MAAIDQAIRNSGLSRGTVAQRMNWGRDDSKGGTQLSSKLRKKDSLKARDVAMLANILRLGIVEMYDILQIPVRDYYVPVVGRLQGYHDVRFIPHPDQPQVVCPMRLRGKDIVAIEIGTQDFQRRADGWAAFVFFDRASLDEPETGGAQPPTTTEAPERPHVLKRQNGSWIVAQFGPPKTPFSIGRAETLVTGTIVAVSPILCVDIRAPT